MKVSNRDKRLADKIFAMQCELGRLRLPKYKRAKSLLNKARNIIERGDKEGSIFYSM